VPFVMCTAGIHRIHTQAIASGFGGLRAAVIATGGTMPDTTIRDATLVNQIIGVNSEIEVTNPGYGRQTLAGVTVAPDTGNDWVLLSATAPVIASVSGATPVWRRILYYFTVGTEGAAGDTAHIPLGMDTPASTLTPNGGNITLPPLQIRFTAT
jgi:hypothetical protein